MACWKANPTIIDCYKARTTLLACQKTIPVIIICCKSKRKIIACCKDSSKIIAYRKTLHIVVASWKPALQALSAEGQLLIIGCWKEIPTITVCWNVATNITACWKSNPIIKACWKALQLLNSIQEQRKVTGLSKRVGVKQLKFQPSAPSWNSHHTWKNCSMKQPYITDVIPGG
jgi:hypothetical protein